MAEKDDATFLLQVALSYQNESPYVALESGEVMDLSGVAVDVIHTFALISLLSTGMGLL